MDKYYTPDVSDLFIGYECEYQRHKGEWFCDIITATDIYNFREHPEKVRTPYLTKEQIEKEGWKEIHWREYIKLVDEAKSLYIHFFNGNRQSEDDEEYMSEFKVHNGTRVMFSGKCPSVNEFRKICKLLGI